MASLVGCADVRTAVWASGAPDWSAASDMSGTSGEASASGISGTPDTSIAPRIYAVTRTSSQAASPEYSEYEALVRDALAQQGFVPAPGDSGPPPRYRVSLAYDSHIAAVGVDDEDCAEPADSEPRCVSSEMPHAGGHGGYTAFAHGARIRPGRWPRDLQGVVHCKKRRRRCAAHHALSGRQRVREIPVRRPPRLAYQTSRRAMRVTPPSVVSVVPAGP